MNRRLLLLALAAAGSCLLLSRWTAGGLLPAERLPLLLFILLTAWGMAFLVSPWLLGRLDPAMELYGTLLWGGVAVGMVSAVWYIPVRLPELAPWLPIVLAGVAGVGVIGQAALHWALSALRVSDQQDGREPKSEDPPKL